MPGIFDLVFAASNPKILYAAAYSGDYGTTVLKSEDGGASWNGAGLNTNDLISALAVDPNNPDIVYAGLPGGVFKSTDGAASWSPAGLATPQFASALLIDPGNSNTLYAANGGVSKSTDGGATWSVFNDGLTNLIVHALAIDRSGRYLHAGTGAGVFDVSTSSSPQPNQIDDAQFFVRQHYLDFLNREPDAGGLAYWTNQITQCGNDAACIHSRRIGVSAAFFIEQEFQDTGYYVYRFYRASFGRQPNYTEFTADRGNIIGGANLDANKQAFADEWVQRAAFLAAYPITMSNTEVVNKLFDSAGLTASIYDAQRQQEIAAMNAGRSRALVLRDVVEIPDFKNIPDPNDPRYSEIKQTSQYNPAFVLMQYFGYLRRDLDQSGYDFWLNVVNNREPNNYRGMVCSFLTSSEYQLRFGTTVTRSNADCSR